MRSLLIALLFVPCAQLAHAQQPPAPRDTIAGRDTAFSDSSAVKRDSARIHRDSIARLSVVHVTAAGRSRTIAKPIQALTLPVTASVTASAVQQTVNAVDAEDAVKYLPSVFLRKRNNGDTQATLGTRVWGVSSSARSLVFADGVPLSALIANNNNIGGPRWGLVSPAEIVRVDMMYGPFSAAYAGNSMGAVMEITTRMPDTLTGSVSQVNAVQKFDLYGTRRSFGTSQTMLDVGDRFGRFAFRAGGSFEDSHSQPLTYVTSSSLPSGTSGGFAEQNKLGAPANVLGAGGLLHTRMLNGKLKASYDLTPTLKATYTFGVWRNDAAANSESFLSANGRTTFASQGGFASGLYELDQRHTAHSVALRTDRRGDWDMEAVASRYSFDHDRQRGPSAASSTDTVGTAGRIAVLDGTHWSTLDLKGTWHRGGPLAKHTVTGGVHHDAYALNNPTFNSSDWRAGTTTTVATEGDGKTRTSALWLQDAWRLNDFLTLTVGARQEWWRAYDGFNANGSTNVVQPVVSASRVSPKAVLAWTPTVNWSATASVGKAYRFATPAELYQLVSTGSSFTSPDPNLKPDNVLAAELRVTRSWERSRVQLALFQDDVHDAIISQFLPLVPNSPTLYSFVSNVDHVRARGVELSAGGSDVFMHGLDLTVSGTYLDAKTLALSGRASATAPAGSAIGAQLPNIPKWRANFVGTYRAGAKTSFTLAGRYSGVVYTTLDNADVHPNTYQGFGEWFVADARATYAVNRHWTTALGVDNLLDRKYFLFHPFPQRTVVASATYAF